MQNCPSPIYKIKRAIRHSSVKVLDLSAPFSNIWAKCKNRKKTVSGTLSLVFFSFIFLNVFRLISVRKSIGKKTEETWFQLRKQPMSLETGWRQKAIKITRKIAKTKIQSLWTHWPKVQRTTQQNIESESGLDNTRCFPYFERII